MSTNKKALFFDIDGTILSEVTGKIPESASAALQKAHDLRTSFIYQHRTDHLLSAADDLPAAVQRLSVWLRKLYCIQR